MNILPVSYPKIFNNSSVQHRKKSNEISFGIKISANNIVPENNILSNCRVPFIDFVEYSANKHNKKLKVPAANYLTDVGVIATMLEPLGVSFDRAYCEPNAIKSGKTVADKVLRSGTLIIPDRIRATLYNKNIYNMEILFNHILPEFEKHGYEIAYVEKSLDYALMKGYTPSQKDIEHGYMLCPDIDIRLNRKYVENIESIPQKYKYSLGEPQESGYEDIQIRFIKSDGNSHPMALRELIILSGPEYAKAKHDESENIYSYTRQFKKLNILNSKNKDETIELLKQYIKNITDIFSYEITQKLYGNAMSFDRVGIKGGKSITISERDEKDLTENYNNIEKITRLYYKGLLESASNSEEYKIYSRHKDADLDRLGNIRSGLTKAIKFYKQQNNE